MVMTMMMVGGDFDGSGVASDGGDDGDGVGGDCGQRQD